MKKATIFVALIALGILTGCGNTPKKATAKADTASPLEYKGTYDSYTRPANAKSIVNVSLVADAIKNMPDGEHLIMMSSSNTSVTFLNRETKSNMMYTTARGTQAYFITEKLPGKEINLVFQLSRDSTDLSVLGSNIIRGKDTTKLTYEGVETLIADGYKI